MGNKEKRREKLLAEYRGQREELLQLLEGREEIHPNEKGCLERLEEKIAEIEEGG